MWLLLLCGGPALVEERRGPSEQQLHTYTHGRVGGVLSFNLDERAPPVGCCFCCGVCVWCTTEGLTGLCAALLWDRMTTVCRHHRAREAGVLLGSCRRARTQDLRESPFNLPEMSSSSVQPRGQGLCSVFLAKKRGTERVYSKDRPEKFFAVPQSVRRGEGIAKKYHVWLWIGS